MKVTDLLRLMLKENASDLFVTAGAPPSLRVDGKVLPLESPPLTAEQSRDLAHSIMDEGQRGDFEATKECNFAVNSADLGRFRVNVFVQQGRVGMVLRRINTEIPTFDQLRLPAVMGELALMKSGMLLIVGGTGSGKTTTQAALLGYRNLHTRGHIITLEDPIEYVHECRNCIITQREVGLDTDSFDVALQNVVRQGPDVIQIGEIRKRETMDSTLVFSETGQLCLATMHASNSYQALDRIINFFPHDRREQLLIDLSLNLAAVVSQRLVPRKDGRGRVAALEILINTPLIADVVRRGELHKIHDVMERSNETGMVTMDQSLLKLFRDGLVTYEDALRNAESVNNLRLSIKLQADGSTPGKLGSSLEGATF